MAFIRADRVLETTTTTGIGTLTLGTSVGGYRPFAAVMAVDDTCIYTIEDGIAWEVGIGTFGAGNTLARTVVIASSNTNARINLSAGAKRVFLTEGAQQLDRPKIDVFQSSGTYAKPPEWARYLRLFGVTAGGGGGSGRKGAAGSGRAGGGGGGGSTGVV